MAKAKTVTAPPGLQAARDAAKAVLENSTALRRLVDRVTVVDEGGFTEVLIDGETVVGGNGPEAVWMREFGRLVEDVKADPTPHLDRSRILLAALKWMVEVYREEDTPDDKQPEAVKAALAAISEAEAAS